MEFGLFNSLYLPGTVARPDGVDPEYERLMDEVAVVEAADRSGFKYTWATEHHFLPEYSHLSANESFLPFVAARTERIHVGSGIFNITPPVNHPARVAERAAMIDQLSGGRFELGVGRGSSTIEQEGFGIDDPNDTKDMLDEVLGELKYMWRDGEYGHDGRWFSMPPRRVLPKPHAKPHPPLWMAAGSPSTFEKAGRLGVGVLCFSVLGPDSLAPLIARYKELVADAEPVGEYVNDNVMVTSQLMCLEDGRRARKQFCTMGTGYQNSLVFRYLDTIVPPPGIPRWPELIPDPTPAELEDRIGAHLTCAGDPDEVATTLEAFERAGADQVTFGLMSSTVDRDTAVEVVETFGRHVLPRFDTDPVHRTTRQRQAWLDRQPTRVS